MQSLCIVHLLTNKMVSSFQKEREEEIYLMMEKVEKASSSSSTVNLSQLFITLTSDVMSKIALGRKYSSDEGTIDIKTLVRTFAQGRRSDFVGTLLSIQREKMTPFVFDRSDIKLIILDIFIGGTATTSTLLEWTMTELMRHPECMKKLRDEICSVSKHTLYVIINAWAIQRDIATWGLDAEEFKPERHLNSCLDFDGQDLKFIPFGSGRRLCPGIRLALVLVEVSLANLVKRFEWKVKVGPYGLDRPDLAEATGIEACRKFPLIVFPTSASSVSPTATS
uniref:Cytochrome P450 71A16 n=1 Tax=Isatis tinctoria TaxID=161756 RepID=A0A8H2S9B0_ISATI|nr:cytochrome P450 71A16 [Isatis tinctoria]